MNQRHRVFVPQALGSGEFLRITWHESRDVAVFSHWTGDECTAALPVRVADLGDTVALLSAATRGNASDEVAAWPAPEASKLIVPAAGLSIPRSRSAAC